MKTGKKILSLILVMACVCGCLVGCGSSNPKEASDGNTLIMATNAAFPPYEYVEDDAYAGIDVEIAGKIAEELGMELEIKDVEFGSIIAGVESKKYDMGMAGMTVTEERKQSVNFTDTYATAVQSVIVPEGSSIQTLDDITSDMKIGVQQDTTGDIYASDDYGDAVVRYKNGADAVLALVSGKVDCVIIDNEPAKAFVSSNENLVILESAYAEEEYAICVAKDNEQLLNDINAALAKLKADGTIDEIVSKYIKTEE
ncbi:MAG: transporter substrate-binding domain-containing protein [Lachnospiraceae bacterium]|nr:transporter substrate-binding domain-containing protein [Lachnospiraceae bacterium]